MTISELGIYLSSEYWLNITRSHGA